MKASEMFMAFGTYREKRNDCGILVGKTEGRRYVIRSRLGYGRIS